MHLGGWGNKTPNPPTFLLAFTERSQGTQHASGVPQSPLGYTYCFPAYVGVNIGESATLKGQCWQSHCLGELVWSGIAWSTSAMKYSAVPTGLRTHSRLVWKWQEISALCLLSLPWKQGVSMFPQELCLHL